MYLHAKKKKQFYTSYSFWYIKLLKILQSDWSRAFLHITWELYFTQTCDFCRTIKANMMHLLKQKNLHINGLNILQNFKNLILGVFLSIIPKMRFFPQNYEPVNFFTFNLLQRHVELQKTPMNRFGEKVFTYWHTDLPTYWHQRIPFGLKAGVQKSTFLL